MRYALAMAGLLLLVPTATLAQQSAPEGAAPDTGPSLKPSMEPNLSTDAVSLENVRNNIQKDRTKSRAARAAAARPANPTDIIAGKPVHDTAGQLLAIVEKIEADGAVVRSGASVVKVPLDGFGVNKKGLLLNMTKPQFEALVAGATATPQS